MFAGVCIIVLLYRLLDLVLFRGAHARADSRYRMSDPEAAPIDLFE